MGDKMLRTARDFSKAMQRSIDLESIINHMEKHYHVKTVFFNTQAGDREIVRYDLQSKTAKAPAFTYCGTARIIFIDNELPYEEKIYTILHEIAHILLGHLGDGKLFVRDKMFIDIEADAFAYHVLKKGKMYR